MTPSEDVQFSDEMVDLGDGLRLPREVAYTEVTHTEGSRAYTATAHIRYIGNGYRCTRFEMDFDTTGDPTADPFIPESSGLISVNVWRFISWGVWTAANAAIERQLNRSDTPEERRIRHASLLYRVAEMIGFPPRKAVREMLGVSTSTAGRLLSEARERGYLHEPDNIGGRPKQALNATRP